MTGQGLEHSRLLLEIINNNAKGYVLEGGSRSSKTWSIIQYLCLYCQANRGKEITITRDRLTWLKLTVIRDIRKVLEGLGWWKDKNYNKQDGTYELLGNVITFVGLDEPAKLHGLRQDIFWINEAIGTPGSAFNPTLDNFDQLEMRTSEKFFIDYNPKVTKHWIYDKVLTRSDVHYIHSTQLDNPFLGEEERKKILSYEKTDPIKWQIYGLGKRAQHEGVIFKNISYVREIPSEAKLIAYGLDFGFTNDPTALIEVRQLHGELWLNEIIYETGLTNPQITGKMKGITGDVIADSAEPKSITELRNYGVRIEAAKKGADSVRHGIEVLQRFKINVTERSLGLKSELENYSWKTNPQTGESINEPVDNYNHAIDAIRYVALNRIGAPISTTVRGFINKGLTTFD